MGNNTIVNPNANGNRDAFVFIASVGALIFASLVLLIVMMNEKRLNLLAISRACSYGDYSLNCDTNMEVGGTLNTAVLRAKYARFDYVVMTNFTFYNPTVKKSLQQLADIASIISQEAPGLLH